MKQERKLSHRDPVVAHLTNTFQDLQVLLANTVFLLFVSFLFVCVLCLATRFYHCLLSFFYFLSLVCVIHEEQRNSIPYTNLGYSLRWCLCRQILLLLRFSITLLRFSNTFSDFQLDIQDHKTMNENLNHCKGKNC